MIIFIIGTRSEAIKFSTIIRECQKRRLPFKILNTGQHSGLDKLLKQLELKKFDIYLPKSPREVWSKKTRILAFLIALVWGIKTFLRLIYIFRKEKPKIVFYQGDTMMVPISAIAAKLSFCGIKTAHREAGLRSHNIFEPFPEELCRVIGDKFTDILFAPTKTAVKNLKREKVKGKIYYVQDCMPEILDFALKKFKFKSKPKGEYIVVHVHHQENIHSKERMEKLVEILNNSPFNVIYPASLFTKENLKKFGLLKKIKPHVKIIDYLEYPKFINLIKNAKAVLSDSGGLQAECCIMKVPYIALHGKCKNEWIETVKAGCTIVSQFNEEEVLNILYDIKNKGPLYQKVKKAKNPLGDGKATKRIVNILTMYLSQGRIIKR